MPGTQPPRAIPRVVLGSPTSPYGRDPASSSERRCSTRARGERTPSGAQPASPSSSPGQRALGKREAPSRLPGLPDLLPGVLTARRATARTAMAPGSLARTLRGARRSLQVSGGGGARGAATATFNCAASANERARAAFERQRPRARRLRTRRAARKRTGGAP